MFCSRNAGDIDSIADRDVVHQQTRTSLTVIKKRGIFPKPTTNTLRAWLFQNLAVSKNYTQ